MAQDAVPRDQLLQSIYTFEPVKRETVESTFKKAHRLSEDVYRGKGRWEPGPIRHTSRRVIAYLCAHAATEERSYLRRAKEGLEFLLQEQRSAGNFLWTHHSHEGWDRLDHCYYDTGIAGRAFVYGAKILGDPRYLEASKRAADWAIPFPISPNNNYNLFAVWHLAAHYRMTRDPACLEAAIHKTREGGFPEQLPGGGWPGHNSWIWYHGIILRGMAELLDVLPEGHPFIPELQASLIAGFNRIIREQRKTGQAPPNPGSMEKTHKNVFCLDAALIAEPAYPGLTNTINGLAHFLLKEFRSVKRIGKTIWPEPPEARDEILWKADLNTNQSMEGWGQMPAGSFRCWFPGFEPESGDICFSPEQVYGRNGSPCIEIKHLKGRGHCGFGFRMPESAVVSGRYYRLSAWMRVHESHRAQGTATMCYLSAYSGPERPSWDAHTGCEFTLETPAIGYYRPIYVDFRAGSCNYANFMIQSQPIEEGRPVSLFVSDIEIKPLQGPLPASPQQHEHLDADMMGLGVLLGYRWARRRIV